MFTGKFIFILPTTSFLEVLNQLHSKLGLIRVALSYSHVTEVSCEQWNKKKGSKKPSKFIL